MQEWYVRLRQQDRDYIDTTVTEDWREVLGLKGFQDGAHQVNRRRPEEFVWTKSPPADTIKKLKMT